MNNSDPSYLKILAQIITYGLEDEEIGGVSNELFFSIVSIETRGVDN